MREPVIIIGGVLSDARDYQTMAEKLSKPPYERPVFITKVNRVQWAFTNNENFQVQIRALTMAVAEARKKTGAEKVWLVGHSAGGRVARLWMGDKPYGGNKCNGRQYVRGLICLGTPYITEEARAIASANFANQFYPGAFYPEITYISAVGKTVFGRKNGTIEQRLAYKAYQTQSPNNPNQWGDGVVTVEGAFMPGAENHILDGIYHVGLFGKQDYAAPDAMKVWGSVLEQL